LLKADKLGGAGRAIGRPRNSGAAVEDSHSRPAIEKVARRAGETIEDAYARQCAERAAQYDAGGAKCTTGFEIENHFVEMTGRVAAEPLAVPPPVRAFAEVAAPQAISTKPKFEEPSKIVDVSELKVDPHLAALVGGDDPAAERYRTLGVRLVSLAARRKLKTIVITSAVEGEGKTTVALNLAWVMAKRRERRVLLMDASAGHSSAARLLGVSPAFGWLDPASEESSLNNSIVRIDPNGIYLAPPRSMASGEVESHTASTVVEKLAGRFEDQFDLILIDAPALLESSDAQQLASIADGTVIVARAGRTHRDRVSDAINLIPEDRRLGLVLNDSEIEAESVQKRRGRLPGQKNRK